MNQSVVTVLMNNQIVKNCIFDTINEGEAIFKNECKNLDISLDDEDLENCLDDGYFDNGAYTVCINSFNHDFKATHGIIVVENNCIDYISIHYNEYALKSVFRDMLELHASNGGEYSSEDIQKCMDEGLENIGGKIKIYYVKF